MSYPYDPGYQDTDTSRAAAHEALKFAKSLRKRVWAAISLRPATVFELEQRWGLLNQTASPRMSELSQMGLVEDSGARRPAASGQDAIVWRAIQPFEAYDAVEMEFRKHKLGGFEAAARRLGREMEKLTKAYRHEG